MSFQPPPVYIVASVRTPIGAFRGSLSSLSATDLGSHVIKSAIARVPRLKNDQVDEVFFGNVLSAGLGQNVARQCALGAGLPVSTVCTTVNKVCASSMKAITLAAQTIQLGYADVVVAGGTESMSNAPNYIPAIAAATNPQRKPSPSQDLLNGVVHDGLTDAYGKREHMGFKGELCAKNHNITREQQDRFAVQSYQKAHDAVHEGHFRGEIAPLRVTGPNKRPTLIKEDELISKLDKEKMKALSPIFLSDAKGGTVTAANSPALSDGASAIVLVSEDRLHKLGLTPLAKILGFADAETHPGAFTTAPALALPKALSRSNMGVEDLDAIEINEAFAVAAVANIKLLNANEERVNIHGGAVALGHPLGSSGCRVVTTLLGVLKHKGGRVGAATICNGGGGATALVLENMQSNTGSSKALKKSGLTSSRMTPAAIAVGDVEDLHSSSYRSGSDEGSAGTESS